MTYQHLQQPPSCSWSSSTGGTTWCEVDPEVTRGHTEGQRSPDRGHNYLNKRSQSTLEDAFTEKFLYHRRERTSTTHDTHTYFLRNYLYPPVTSHSGAQQTSSFNHYFSLRFDVAGSDLITVLGPINDSGSGIGKENIECEERRWKEGK